MPNLVRAPAREVRSRIFDSARWAVYKPRADDIIVATYPKCGTTWTQRIVQMLIDGDAAPKPMTIPWFDMRIAPFTLEMAAQLAESVQGRRQLKSHLPYDALPVYEGVKFIHVARDGRDSAMSYHHHIYNFTEDAFARADAVSMADPKFGTPMPRVDADVAAYFHLWLNGLDCAGDERAGFWHTETSYWERRRDPNLLLVHYNDLKADRDGEMRRIAAFLEIDVSPALWPAMVEAAGFERMREQGKTLLPHAAQAWKDGADSFLNKGVNGRWKDVYRAEDLAAYDAKVKASFSPALAKWIEQGRLGAGDPARSPD
jgi:aryl sulfotransferase